MIIVEPLKAKKWPNCALLAPSAKFGSDMHFASLKHIKAGRSIFETHKGPFWLKMANSARFQYLENRLSKILSL